MFSGSIYGMTLAGLSSDGSKSTGVGLTKMLGPITPIGGICMIAGWVVLARGGRLALS
jgi:uncharacterized membrane protein YgdD (TMEM256/DUF423 family)